MLMAAMPFIRRLLLLAAVLAAVSATSAIRTSTASDVPIEILVLPATPGPEEGEPTVSALLFGGAPEPAEGVETPWLDLMVTDEQGAMHGWTVKIMTAPSAEPGQEYLLNRYLRRVEPGDRHLADGADAPRGDVLSIGQPLDAMTSVIVAEPGSDAGTYRVRFEVAGTFEGTFTPPSLIIAVTAAP